MMISEMVVGDAALTAQLCPGLYLNSAYGEREQSEGCAVYQPHTHMYNTCCTMCACLFRAAA